MPEAVLLERAPDNDSVQVDDLPFRALVVVGRTTHSIKRQLRVVVKDDGRLNALNDVLPVEQPPYEGVILELPRLQVRDVQAGRLALADYVRTLLNDHAR